MASHVCPWQHAYWFDNALRRLVFRIDTIFGPYVRPGMTVMDVGCGMGFNAIGLARIVGDAGCVIAVDLQPQMLEVLRKRAKRAGVAHRIRTHQCESDSIGVDDAVDFAVAFWVIHEVPDVRAFLQQMRSCLVENGKFLVVEPRFHVSSATFQDMLATAEEVGLRPGEQLPIRLSRAVVLSRD
jgi:ubiquinone/menaquinone biosynthesis C-methylase UbiE